MAELQPSACPGCGYVFGKTTAINETEARTPKAGDFALCASCGALNVFTEGLKLRLSTLDDLDRMDPRRAAALGCSMAMGIVRTADGEIHLIKRRTEHDA